MLPANPTQDTMGPMTRTVADAARVLDVIAGYDPNDPITAATVGNMPASYAAGLAPTALRGARIGVLRMRRDSSATPRPAAVGDTAGARRAAEARLTEAEFAKVRPLFERAIADLRAQGAVVVDSVAMPTVPGRRVGNDFETEEATDRYFAQHPNAPYRTLKEILLAGGVTPSRARALMSYVGRSTSEADYGAVLQYREAQRVALLKVMADRQLDALIYATYDAPPAVIPADALTNARAVDGYGRGDNRGLSPSLGWPALTVPMGFSPEGLPAGLEFLGRPWSEGKLLGFAYAYEQATHHRRPPMTVPALSR
jgi:Asp-tRNA(Asn)/Glu-tRNA(Gln) amidotransferase A subunit family amidase